MIIQDFPHENEKGQIYNMYPYSNLVEVIDRQCGYVLIKNLLWTASNEVYSVAVELSNGSPKIVSENCSPWLNHQAADKIMREILNNPTYNKATKDFMNNYEA